MSASGLGFAMVEEAVAPATPARGCGFDRILKAQIKGRLLLSEEEKATLAEIAHRLPRKSLRLRLARLRIWWFDPIAEASELANHSRGALLL